MIPQEVFKGVVKDLSVLKKEITKEQAEKLPSWGTGHLSVSSEGICEWVNTNWDTSG